MRVHAVCGYRSKSDAWTDAWRNVDYRARNLVKGLKGEDFRGFSEWTVKATQQVLKVENTAEGRETAFRVALSLLLDRFSAAGIQEAAVVPIPSSQTVTPGGAFTGARLAQGLAAIRPKLVASPVLHFDEPQKKAHLGGSRSPHDIARHLRGTLPPCDGPVVLLDDVLTTGGHARACARYLRQQGHQVADMFVVGRTVWERPDEMFKMPVEQFDV